MAHFGDFEYTLDGTNATIVAGYDGAGGAVVIPSTIDTGNYPVVALGVSAFNNIEIDSISIPSSVTSILTTCFQDVDMMTSVIFEGTPTSLSLGANSFSNCASLTSIILPENTISIATECFYSCTSLASATFKGNAPATMGTQAFRFNAVGFKVYYYTGATGFTTPTWPIGNGDYPTEMIGSTTTTTAAPTTTTTTAAPTTTTTTAAPTTTTTTAAPTTTTTTAAPTTTTTTAAPTTTTTTAAPTTTTTTAAPTTTTTTAAPLPPVGNELSFGNGPGSRSACLDNTLSNLLGRPIGIIADYPYQS